MVLVGTDASAMTEYNIDNRETKIKGESPNNSLTSVLMKQYPLRRDSTMASSDLWNEYDFGSSSDAALNDFNRENYSYTQPSSIDALLASSSNGYEQSSTTTSSIGNIKPSLGSSFAQLALQKFETYIESRTDKIVPPLEEMICGYGFGIARLAQSTHSHLQPPHLQQGEFVEPIALRRQIRSTPVLPRTSNSALSAINNEEHCKLDIDEDYPPPTGLDILDFIRSRSTPLTTSENSAFGTILRLNPRGTKNNCKTSNDVQSNCGVSAFSLPPYPMKKVKTGSNEKATRPVVFNPIVHEDEILKAVDDDNFLGEITSIEVTNIPPNDCQVNQLSQLSKKKTAATRTAKFLTDIRNLRIRGGNGSKRSTTDGKGRSYPSLDGRENPARPASLSSDEQSSSSAKICSARLNTTEKNELLRPVFVAISTSITSRKSTGTSVSSLAAIENGVNVQVNNYTIASDTQSYSASSSEYNEVLDQADRLFPFQDSIDSTTCAQSIANSSIRSSQWTSSSSNGRSNGSHLSSISETDREVANVNLHKCGRRPIVVGEQIELSLSPDRGIIQRDLNVSVNISTPDSSIRRDGASVRADRFFKYRKDSNRLRHLSPFMKSSSSAQATTVVSNGASVNIGSPNSSDEPPKIVSYIDRKQVSDLSSLHHRQFPFETSSPRSNHDQEVRDSSPSEQIQARDVDSVFQGAYPAQIDICRLRSYGSGHNFETTAVRKNRSLPPRSPCNHKTVSTTPPPLGESPVCNAISTPDQSIGDRLGPFSSNLSNSYAVAPTSYRSNSEKPLSTNLPMPTSDKKSEPIFDLNQIANEVATISPNCEYYNIRPSARGLSPVYGQQAARTYQENCIEILKSDSKDENLFQLVKKEEGNPTS